MAYAQVSRGSSLNVLREGVVIAVILLVVMVIFSYGLWNLVAPTGVSVGIVRSECSAPYGYGVSLSFISTALMVYSVYRIFRLSRVDYLALGLIVLAMVLYFITMYAMTQTSSLC